MSANLEGVTLARGGPTEDSTAPSSSWASSSSPKASKLPDDRPPLYFNLPTSQQVGIHKNPPKKSSDPLLLHLQFLPPTFCNAVRPTSANSKPKKPTESSTSSAHAKPLPRSPPLLVLSCKTKLTRVRQQRPPPHSPM